MSRCLGVLRIIPAYAGSTRELVEDLLGVRDHPRIRGEHSGLPLAEWRRAGSSPHTRGAPGGVTEYKSGTGIIPAYAGSTDGARPSPVDQLGSSPHTRGAPCCRVWLSHPPRIIPAYAGSTLRDRRGARNVGDHPRIRGEHDETYRKELNQTGSSPHTRGALRFSVPRHWYPRGSSPHTRGARVGSSCASPMLRIIPAYAGSTGSNPSQLYRGQDHPRIRGEHSLAARGYPTALGSSPHTRGAPAYAISAQRHGRIIPAYAGSTNWILRSVSARRDHPRIRGEHAWLASAAIPALGSSPHTRGAPVDVQARLTRGGIIPAYAGSTHTPLRSRRPARDHPRIRGEHYAKTFEDWNVQGSSPHTRGALIESLLRVDNDGIIPAYAGSTFRRAMKPSQAKDHPRIRGEHTLPSPARRPGSGSSPHTRGALA